MRLCIPDRGKGFSMKKKIKIMLCAAAISAAVLPVWSNTGKTGEDKRPLVSISQKDVINMTGKTVNLNTLINHLNNDLVETGLYRIVSMDDLLKAVQNAEQMSVIADVAGGGTMITTSGSFIGLTITAYDMNAVGGMTAIMGATVANESARIELILKVVDARTGETIKTQRVEGRATGQVIGGSGSSREQIFQAALKNVCASVVYELVKLTPFGVLDVENGLVLLDVPGSLKIMGMPIRIGTQFVVSKLGRGKKSKRTGKVTNTETQVAVVSIASIGANSCSAQITSGSIAPIGDDEDTQYDSYIVKINECAAAAPAADNGTAPL